MKKERIVEKGIYDLRLHETLRIEDGGGWEILRVADGWIYQYQDGQRGYKIFVPFNNEFMDEKEIDVPGLPLSADINSKRKK